MHEKLQGVRVARNFPAQFNLIYQVDSDNLKTDRSEKNVTKGRINLFCNENPLHPIQVGNVPDFL